jgi:hypothetical protein
LRRASSILGLASALALAGCVSGFDRNDQIVDSLRILGVGQHVDSGDGIDWADADAGDTIHLSALVANPGGLSTVTVTWLACLPIPGQTQPCTDPNYLRDPTTVIPMANDPSTGVYLLGQGTDIDYTVPSTYQVQALLQSLLTRADMMVNAECALYTQIPLLVVAQDAANGAVFAAVKNIRLSPWKEIQQLNDPAYMYYVRNINPAVGALNLNPPTLTQCDGQALYPGDTFPEGPQTICLVVGQAQTYYTCTFDGPDLANPVPEQPGVIWYMTGGALNGFAAPNDGSGSSLASRTYTVFTRPPGPFTLYGVVRDGRDGEAWIAQDFQ